MKLTQKQYRRRQFLALGGGLLSTAFLAACGSGGDDKKDTAAGAPTTVATAVSDLNAMGWPKKIEKLSIAVIPLEDAATQQSKWKPLNDIFASNTGVPVDFSITTSYAALVQAQKNKLVSLGYYGPLSFLLAEQQFGAIPILIDAPDGKTPGNYHSMLIAGKDSGIKTVADIKGKDFAFVDPASTSGNLFPRAMLLEEGIDPNKDIKGRFAGNHDNAILAVAKGQVPAGGTNDVSIDNAVKNGAIKREDLIILKTSAPIPNGPFAVHPEFDKRAVKKLQEAAAKFTDPAALKAILLQGVLIPMDTAIYDPVRKAAKIINLQFDEKGNALPQGS